MGALWPTWDAYLATGQRFMTARTGASFFDSSGSVYLNMLMQLSDHTYYDTANNLVIDTNPAVKAAWDKTVQMIQAGLSGNIAAYSPQWNAELQERQVRHHPLPLLDARHHREAVRPGERR
nr:hypothetical protein GCM10020092_073100 [Actinoplanes digitatis]